MSVLDDPRRRVRGERGIATVARTLSLQARVSHWLAMGVMLLVGCALLGWYYAHQVGREPRIRRAAGPARQSISAEMALPPLGPLDPPSTLLTRASPGPASAAVATAATADATARAPGAASDPRAAEAAVAPVLLAGSPGNFGVSLPPLEPTVPRPGRGAMPPDRRLSAEVYVAAAPLWSSRSPAVALPQPPSTADTAAVTPAVAAVAPDAVPGTHLSAPMAVPVAARALGAQSLILPKGTSIDCTLETAIDSTLPGLTRCLTATDTFGADGHVVLLERGTELVGETQGQVQQGAARVFVLWNEARTPRGVIVPLESPGTDELGRAGLSGTVQRHFWERFGAAILVSTIDGAVQAAAQSGSRDNGTVIYNPGASQDVMTEVLRSTVTIPPTVRKANGDRIQVLVARDVDFGAVYELRASDTDR